MRGISPASQRAGRTAPFLKVTRSSFAFWGLGSGRPFPFGAGARVLVGWRARILEEDARLWFPGCRASFRRVGHARPDATHLPPGPGCDLQSAIRGSDLRDHLLMLPAAPGVCSASPSDSPGSQARLAALANQHHCLWPLLAPQPMRAPAMGHRPRGEGEGGAGAESDFDGCARGSRRRTARAGARGWGRGSRRIPSKSNAG